MSRFVYYAIIFFPAGHNGGREKQVTRDLRFFNPWQRFETTTLLSSEALSLGEVA